jgi:ferric-dicitrate binding protein FerR (iron transport regulator)
MLELAIVVVAAAVAMTLVSDAMARMLQLLSAAHGKRRNVHVADAKHSA